MSALSKLGRRLQSHLTRSTTSGSVIPVVDGLRLIAIMGVVFFHGTGYAKSICPEIEQVGFVAVMRLGWFGVELFFVISGFILAHGFAAQYLGNGPPLALRDYYLRRLTRLEPPYILALLLYYCLKTFLYRIPGLESNLLASIFYLHTTLFGERSPVLGVAWSLEVEVQYYLLAPLLAKLFLLRPTWLRRTALVLLIVGMELFSRALDLQTPSILKFLHFFQTGLLLCDIYWVDWRQGKEIRKSPWWDLFGATAWILLWLVLSSFVLLRPLIPMLLVVAFAGAFRGSLTSRVLSNPFVYLTGGMCYTIYLYHTILLRGLILELPIAQLAFDRMGPTWGMAVVLAAATSLVLLLCSTLFLLFEKPFMHRDWPRRVTTWLMSHRTRSEASA